MPTVPGSDGLIQSEEEALAVAQEVPCTASVSYVGLRIPPDMPYRQLHLNGPACVWIHVLACLQNWAPLLVR